MKTCPKCSIEHNKSGTYCSRSCANARTHTEESKRKIGIGVKKSPNRRKPMSNEEIENRSQKVKKLRLDRYLNTPFEKLGMENRRRRVFEEQEHKCNRCGITNW